MAASAAGDQKKRVPETDGFRWESEKGEDAIAEPDTPSGPPRLPGKSARVKIAARSEACSVDRSHKIILRQPKAEQPLDDVLASVGGRDNCVQATWQCGLNA